MPGGNEGEQADDDEHGAAVGKDDLSVDVKGVRAIDLGGFIQFFGKSEHELADEEDVERPCGELGDDQGQEAIDPADRFVDRKQWDQRDLGGDHQGGEQDHKQRVSTLEIYPGKTESHETAAQDLAEDGHHADEQAVPHEQQEAARLGADRGFGALESLGKVIPMGTEVSDVLVGHVFLNRDAAERTGLGWGGEQQFREAVVGLPDEFRYHRQVLASDGVDGDCFEIDLCLGPGRRLDFVIGVPLDEFRRLSVFELEVVGPIHIAPLTAMVLSLSPGSYLTDLSHGGERFEA